jgi:hypothetical protein
MVCVQPLKPTWNSTLGNFATHSTWNFDVDLEDHFFCF